MWTNQLTEKLQIELPIIQAGMVWISGARLAAASANMGCLGVLGAGSMKPEVLEQHILKTKKLTHKNFAVNLPLLYSGVAQQINICLKHNINIFITSAGSPKKFTTQLKDHGATVIHVVSHPDLAIKCENAGVDAVVAEGFEAGGHNGREELTTMVLVPMVVDAVKIPVIAAGGISDARSILAARSLGASAVQIGTRFMMTQESSAHDNYKSRLLNSGPSDTILTLKQLVPVRLIKNKFFQEIAQLEKRCANQDEFSALLGKGRAKLGMLDGDMENGELEAGQVCGAIRDLPTVESLIKNLKKEYYEYLSYYFR